MIDWWNSLSNLQQVLAFIAIPATVILVVQIVLLFIGGDSEAESEGLSEFDELEIDAGSSGLQFLTVKGFVSFFAVFGWSGVLLLELGLQALATLILAFACGAGAMYLIGLAYYYLFKLQENGTGSINDALGVSGTVYIRIPANRGGTGKINAVVGGQYSEFDAMTDEDEPLTTGTSVTVVSISAPNTLIVIKK